MVWTRRRSAPAWTAWRGHGVAGPRSSAWQGRIRRGRPPPAWPRPSSLRGRGGSGRAGRGAGPPRRRRGGSNRAGRGGGPPQWRRGGSGRAGPLGGPPRRRRGGSGRAGRGGGPPRRRRGGSGRAGRGGGPPRRRRCVGSGRAGAEEALPGSSGAVAAGLPRGWAWRAWGWACWPVHRLFYFFLFFYLINRGGQATASENGLFTVTVCPRRLSRTPRLSVFAHLG
jgi:hypothetical protein